MMPIDKAIFKTSMRRAAAIYEDLKKADMPPAKCSVIRDGIAMSIDALHGKVRVLITAENSRQYKICALQKTGVQMVLTSSKAKLIENMQGLVQGCLF